MGTCLEIPQNELGAPPPYVVFSLPHPTAATPPNWKVYKVTWDLVDMQLSVRLGPQILHFQPAPGQDFGRAAGGLCRARRGQRWPLADPLVTNLDIISGAGLEVRG